MHPSISAVRGILQVTTALFEKALGGLDRAALVRRTVPGGNPVIWIAGHMAASRFSMASLLGEPLASPLGPTFAKGAQVPGEADLPEAAQVLAVWRDVSPIVLDRLAQATAERLAAPYPRRLPLDDNSVLGAITFLTYHEGYHIGQLALIRKALGLPGLVDG